MALFARNAFRAFDDVFARELAPILRAPSSFFTVEGGSYPRLDVRETATAYTVDAELAGFKYVRACPLHSLTLLQTRPAQASGR